jgi:ATP-dependent RNA helicase HelY
MVLTLERQVRRISSVEITSPVESILSLKIPKNFNARNAQARRELSQVLANATRDLPPGERHRKSGSGEDAEITELRAELRQHPCHGCDDREAHARWAERLMRAHREVVDLEQLINGRTNTVARRFDRVCDVLTELWFDDEADFLQGMAYLSDPETAAIIQADEEKLFDRSSIRFMVMEDHETVLKQP